MAEAARACSAAADTPTDAASCFSATSAGPAKMKGVEVVWRVCNAKRIRVSSGHHGAVLCQMVYSLRAVQAPKPGCVTAPVYSKLKSHTRAV